jgi:hypothetical protein
MVVGKEPVTPHGVTVCFEFGLRLISTIGMLHVSIIFIGFSKGQGSMRMWPMSLAASLRERVANHAAATD